MRHNCNCLARLAIPLVLSLAGLLAATGNPQLSAREPIDFARDVGPILESNCLRCHYPGHAEGEVDLSTAASLIASDFLAPGDPDSSYLLGLVTSQEGEPAEMPQDAPPLSAEDVAVLTAWIEQGGDWPETAVLAEPSKADDSWWSLQPLSVATPPEIETAQLAEVGQAWAVNPIDRFVLAKLAEQGLRPNPPAAGRDILRRVTYGLTGLPPTPEAVETFLASDADSGYRDLVSRLLASPQYGEHWGRHWLDVVRFGESTGYERNVIIDDAWPFRDYVIRSFNADKPFNQFIREHIAGDCLEDPEALIGSAFLVNGPYDNVGNQDAVQAAQIRANTVDEMIRATTEAFLGLTVGCARCHDHKFDPILQRDYYQLYATFAGVHHGSTVVATAAEKAARAEIVNPLEEQKRLLVVERDAIEQQIASEAAAQAEKLSREWTRQAVDRRGTEDRFEPVQAWQVRFTCDARDDNLAAKSGFRIAELEIWQAGETPRNVGLASEGGVARAASRAIEDFPGAYGPQLLNDGKLGERFISADTSLVIQLAEPTWIDRITFSNARSEDSAGQGIFSFVAEYRIEVSLDGQDWTEIASGRDRQPINATHRDWRLRQAATSTDQHKQIAQLTQEINSLSRQIAAAPPLKTAWLGTRSDADAKREHFLFLGGDPQRLGGAVTPASLSVLDGLDMKYALSADCSDKQRRLALADWIVNDKNALTARVLVNRIWHYHFGTGLVGTPSDFGYMGTAASHPELLDWLAGELIRNNWQVKHLHQLILMSQTYQQSSEVQNAAARVDSEARTLWRFPPRRLTAEEIRDTILQVSGQLSLEPGGPGFRLYDYLQDNVATYVPLDTHGPRTYRRAVYHQTARASRTDFMTDFDQPDCAFSTARRVETTTPLQALCSLNHAFAVDMATHFASRLESMSPGDPKQQVENAFALCFSRKPTTEELADCLEMTQAHSLPAFCRVLLNTSELLYIY